MTKIEILNKYKKQKHNTYRECDVINAMEKYLEFHKQEQALQLQQTDVSGSNVIDESPDNRISRTNKSDYNDYGFYRK